MCSCLCASVRICVYLCVPARVCVRVRVCVRLCVVVGAVRVVVVLRCWRPSSSSGFPLFVSTREFQGHGKVGSKTDGGEGGQKTRCKRRNQVAAGVMCYKWLRRLVVWGVPPRLALFGWRMQFCGACTHINRYRKYVRFVFRQREVMWSMPTCALGVDEKAAHAFVK